jgi:uridine kinase
MVSSCTGRSFNYWDFSIFLDVEFTISIPRCAQRGPGIGSPDPDAAENRRYVEGQRRYLREHNPQQHASIVIDNNDLLSPYMVREYSRAARG